MYRRLLCLSTFSGTRFDGSRTRNSLGGLLSLQPYKQNTLVEGFGSCVRSEVCRKQRSRKLPDCFRQTSRVLRTGSSIWRRPRSGRFWPPWELRLLISADQETRTGANTTVERSVPLTNKLKFSHCSVEQGFFFFMPSHVNFYQK